MPFVEFDHDLRAVGDRTDASGDPVDDLNAREDGLVNFLLGPGVVRPSGGFVVSAAGGSMTVTVGSGDAYADVAAVESQSPQQPPYLVRLRQPSVSVQLDASGQQARTDSIWLVVSNQTWDGSGVRLARVGYRPGSTAPDSGWDAFLLLATVNVPGGASSVSQGNVTDSRVQASVPAALIPQLDAAIVESGEFGVARIPNLPASKTTSGTFADARIPNLNASKVTAGTFTLARIPTIPLSDTSGTLPVNRGGTGGTSAAAARSNLDVLPMSHDGGSAHVAITTSIPGSPASSAFGITLSDVNSGASGAPSGAGGGVVVTHKARDGSTSRAVQTYTETGAATPRSWVRSGQLSAQWSAWREVT